MIIPHLYNMFLIFNFIQFHSDVVKQLIEMIKSNNKYLVADEILWMMLLFFALASLLSLVTF